MHFLEPVWCVCSSESTLQWSVKIIKLTSAVSLSLTIGGQVSVSQTLFTVLMSKTWYCFGMSCLYYSVLHIMKALWRSLMKTLLSFRKCFSVKVLERQSILKLGSCGLNTSPMLSGSVNWILPGLFSADVEKQSFRKSSFPDCLVPQTWVGMSEDFTWVLR